MHTLPVAIMNPSELYRQCFDVWTFLTIIWQNISAYCAVIFWTPICGEVNHRAIRNEYKLGQTTYVSFMRCLTDYNMEEGIGYLQNNFVTSWQALVKSSVVRSVISSKLFQKIGCGKGLNGKFCLTFEAYLLELQIHFWGLWTLDFGGSTVLKKKDVKNKITNRSTKGRKAVIL